MATATASSGGMSFFGTIMHFLRKKEPSASAAKDPKAATTNNAAKTKAANLATYEDELRLLLDTVVLASPDMLRDGITVKITSADPLQPPKKSVIRSLIQLEKDVQYSTDRHTNLKRVSETEVSVAGGKITLPIIENGVDYTMSRTISQYCMKGLLNPDTLIIAIENFTKQKVSQGMLFYEQDHKLGRIFFEFKSMSAGVVYITPDDNIVLCRENTGILIHFTFGRNLHWHHHKGKFETPAQDAAPKHQQLHDRLRAKTIAQQARQQAPPVAPKASAVPAAAAPALDPSVPPPPPPMNGVPPPPPLPSHMHKRKRADEPDVPHPPPFGTFSPVGADGAKRRKLRQLNWSAIPRSKIENTIWREVTSPSKTSGLINESELEDLFSISPTKPKATATNAQGDTVEGGEDGGAKRQTKKFKLTFTEIKEALIQMNDQAFTPEQLVSLKYLFPLTENEVKDISAYKGDPALLANADRFYFETIAVPEVEFRIHLMIFKQQFTNHVEDILSNAAALQKASEELQNSKKFTQILQIILKLGSVLNRSNSSGSSQGFRLETLAKLADTKSKDGKTTVLDYLAQIIRTKTPQLLDFYETDLPSVPSASKLSLDVVVDNIKETKKTLVSLEKELAKFEGNPSLSKAPAAAKQTGAGAFASKFFSSIGATSSANKENAVNQCHGPSVSDFVAGMAGKQAISSDSAVSAQSKPAFFQEGDRFAQVMKPFHVSASKIFSDVELKISQARNAFSKLVTYFGDDPKATTPEQFFSLITAFATDLKQANERHHKALARQQQAQIAQAKRLERAQSKKTAGEAAQTAAMEAAPSTAEAATGGQDAGAAVNYAADAIEEQAEAVAEPMMEAAREGVEPTIVEMQTPELNTEVDADAMDVEGPQE